MLSFVYLSPTSQRLWCGLLVSLCQSGPHRIVQWMAELGLKECHRWQKSISSRFLRNLTYQSASASGRKGEVGDPVRWLSAKAQRSTLAGDRDNANSHASVMCVLTLFMSHQNQTSKAIVYRFGDEMSNSGSFGICVTATTTQQIQQQLLDFRGKGQATESLYLDVLTLLMSQKLSYYYKFFCPILKTFKCVT